MKGSNFMSEVRYSTLEQFRLMKGKAMKALKVSMSLILAACFLAPASPAPAQTPGSVSVHRDLAYDDAHAVQKLDVYLAESEKPTPAMVYIHGGGWRAGSKSHVVERHSSRVACAVSFAGPTDWSLLSKMEHKHPAYRQLLGYEPGTPADAMNAKAKKDVSPVSFVSRDDPPIMQVHGDQDDIVPIEHARNMHERLSHVGVKTRLVVIEGANHGVAGAGPQVAKQAEAFVRRQLLRP